MQLKIISLLFLVSVFTCISYSQEIPENAKHKKIIRSTVYSGQDTVDFRESITYYDSAWKELTNTNTLSAALDNGSKSVVLINTPLKHVSADIKPNGDTLDYIVFLFDEKGNRTHYFQIRNGDTLNNQKREYDENGNNTKLFNSENGKYFLRFTASYNSKNEVTNRETFNSRGKLVKLERYDRYNDGKTTKYFTSDQKGIMILRTKTVEVEKNYFKTTYYEDSEGINYGIILKHENGGYSLTRNSENNNLISLEIYNKKKKMTTSVYIMYEEIK